MALTLVLPTADPVTAEAQGQEHVTATLNGRAWRVPLDADLWPLDSILLSQRYDEHGAKQIHYPALIDALELLLGDQWDDFIDATPRRTGLVEASHAFAAAAGFPGDSAEDLTFGNLSLTLALILKWPAKVESDLDRFWSLDYRDRWRFDDDGRRRLTLRQIHTRLQNLPAESSLALALGRRSGAELLLMDVFKVLAGREHPARPLTAEEAAQARAEQAQLSKARAESKARMNRTKNSRRAAAQLAQRNAAEKQQREGQHAEAS